MKRIGRLFAVGMLAAALVAVANAGTFVVKDIRLDGLARVPATQVYGSLPLNAGDSVDDMRLAEAIRSLFKTGYFEDIQASRDGDVLVLRFSERPSITKIDITGNKSIDKDNLLKGLKQSGLSEGQVLQRSMLDHVKQELQNQYIAQGRYATEIHVDTVARPRNRVEIDIKILEGDVASIRGINFVGNRVFKDEELRDQLQLKIHHLLSIFKSDDKYSREKLSGDLESLRSYYLDRGYANFHILSTQVTLTPDHKDVYIDINVSEGDKYTVNDIKLVGDLPMPEEQLRQLILIKKGQIFSQRLLTSSTELIGKRVGNDGYVFAEVNSDQELNHEKKTADVTIFVNPGQQTYVRRITVKGNTKTDDEVIRREMRQFESALASNDRIDISKQRLQRLGFFKDVKVEKERVPGSSDQVDLAVGVEEQPSGSIGASIGYSQAVGVTLSANVSEDNFFGTGDRVAFGISRNEMSQSANLSLTDPYFTDDGVSRGFNIYSRKTFPSTFSVTNYLTNSRGGNVSFGYPIDETERVSFSAGYDRTEIIEGLFTPLEVQNFVNDHGGIAETWTGSVSWNRSTLNRGVFPDRGGSQTVQAEVTIPSSTVNYYKLTYNGQIYVPITGVWVAHFRTEMGYGNGYLGTGHLPFYKNYFAGGIGSLRGYRDYTVSPRGPDMRPMTLEDGTQVIDQNPSVIGGNAIIDGTAELVMPMPFLKDQSSVRTTLFLDAGEAFDTFSSDVIIDNPGLSGIRYSMGLGISWLTPIGPLTFSLAKALKRQPDDVSQAFQFTIGQGF